MSSEILPCPLCGREPRLSERATSPSETDKGDGRMIYFAACFDGGYSVHVHAFGYSPEERAAKWNRRAEPPCPPEVGRLVAAARAILAKFRSCGSDEARELFAALAPFERPAPGDGKNP